MSRWVSTVKILPEGAICLLLFAATLSAYAQVRSYEFVAFDDSAYITSNYFVRKGLSWEGVKWAFKSTTAGNWHPLTMLSHMADVELYGMDAGKHHWINVLLHASNAAFLFLSLRIMTGSIWRSGLAAGLLALHPLHVESVAWVSERKDVLSAFFFMLTLWSYANYVQKFKALWYLLSILFFIFGLMAKPMLVTLPCILLLLDFWPFKRIIFEGKKIYCGIECSGKVIWEKIPFFFLTIVFSVVTLVVQNKIGAVESWSVYPLYDRITNAIVSYVLYLGKTIYPIKLSVFYPHPQVWRWGQVFSSLLVLGVLSWVSVRSFKKRPWLVVGWFWFVGALVPVIGIIQVGLQGMADRYAYIPLIGIYIAFSWSIFDFFTRYRFGHIWMALCAVIILSNLMIGSFFQVRCWRNTKTLFENAVSVDSGNYLAHTMLGANLIRDGEIQKGLSHIQTSLQLNPNYAKTHYELGLFYLNSGETDKAVHYFSKSIQLNPYDAQSHNNLGIILSGQGNSADALIHFQKAIEVQPQMNGAYNNLGCYWAREGRYDKAISYFKKALELAPNDQQALKNLAAAMEDKQKNKNHSNVIR